MSDRLLAELDKISEFYPKTPPKVPPKKLTSSPSFFTKEVEPIKPIKQVKSAPAQMVTPPRIKK